MNRNVTSVLLVTGYNELQIDAVGDSEKEQKHQRMGGFRLVIRYNFELCLFCDVFFIVYLCACAHICAMAQGRKLEEQALLPTEPPHLSNFHFPLWYAWFLLL